MNRATRIFAFLLIYLSTCSSTITLFATSTNTGTTDSLSSGGGVNSDDFDDFLFEAAQEEEEEASLHLSRWQKFKRWYKEKKAMAELGYNLKGKRFFKKHKKAIISTASVVAASLAALILYRNFRTPKAK